MKLLNSANRQKISTTDAYGSILKRGTKMKEIEVSGMKGRMINSEYSRPARSPTLTEGNPVAGQHNPPTASSISTSKLATKAALNKNIYYSQLFYICL